MAHPLFARLDRQLELVKKELANAEQAEARFQRLKKLGQNYYHEWSHSASLADGIQAIYTGLESILEAIANEIDGYMPQGDSTHANLVDGMAVEVSEVRPAVLNERTRELMHNVRRFRHVVRHRYALELKTNDVAKNFREVRKLAHEFEKDYRRFVKHMTEDKNDGGDQPPSPGASGRR